MPHTYHSEDRLKQRTAYSKRNTEKIAIEAKQLGLPVKTFKGDFKRYLDSLSRRHKTTPFVYKGSIYMFKGELLITVISVNQRFHKYIKS